MTLPGKRLNNGDLEATLKKYFNLHSQEGFSLVTGAKISHEKD